MKYFISATIPIRYCLKPWCIMASQEERDNFFSLALLLFRVGNHKLRMYFKTQWPIVYRRVTGTVPPSWQDTPHDAAEMKKIQPMKLKFKFKDEETKFNSGNTNDWDFSLLTSVLKYSSLHFVLHSSSEEKALDDLKEIRNTLIGHATDAAIPNAVFKTAWTDACNALALFKASAADFKSVQDDVTKPLDALYPMLQQCVKQEKEIQYSVNTRSIFNRLEQLQETVEKHHTTLQTVEKQNTILQQTVEKQHTAQLEAAEAAKRTETKVDLIMLKQGQQSQSDETESKMCPCVKKNMRKRKMSEEISMEDTFSEITGKVLGKWKELGRALKLNESKLKEIEIDHKQYGVHEQAYQMLLAWRESFPDYCTLSSLSEALCKIGLGYVAHQCCMVKI